MTDEKIRELFPNLNEFCSDVAGKLIKWIRDMEIESYDFLLEHHKGWYVSECPDVEFIMDGLRERFYEMEEFDDVILHMTRTTLSKAIGLGTMNDIQDQRINTIGEFLRYKKCDAKTRGRIIVWELTHFMNDGVVRNLESTHTFCSFSNNFNSFNVTRQLIAESFIKHYKEANR